MLWRLGGTPGGNVRIDDRWLAWKHPGGLGVSELSGAYRKPIDGLDEEATLVLKWLNARSASDSGAG
jgi:hypothetical protein